MDSGKTFDMLHCKTLHEKRASIGLNLSAAMSVKKTPNTLLKKTQKTPTKPKQKKPTLNPHPKPNKNKRAKPPNKQTIKSPQTTQTKNPRKKIPKTKQNKNDDEKKSIRNPLKTHHENREIKRNVPQNWMVAGSHLSLFWWLLVMCELEWWEKRCEP